MSLPPCNTPTVLLFHISACSAPRRSELELNLHLGDPRGALARRPRLRAQHQIAPSSWEMLKHGGQRASHRAPACAGTAWIPSGSPQDPGLWRAAREGHGRPQRARPWLGPSSSPMSSRAPRHVQDLASRDGCPWQLAAFCALSCNYQAAR